MSTLSRLDLRSMCRYMHVTRALEDRLEILVRQGHIADGLYRSLGQEATAVGSAFALQEGDWLAPSLRDVGALYVRGLDPRDMLVQYAARGTSRTAGKDRTMHFTVPELGLLGPISPLGTQLCVLNGIALSFKIRGEPSVCMTYQGEGASRTGASHEGLNFAAALRLPMVVILEHNRWSFGTPSSAEAAVEAWIDVALAYGVPAVEVDGNEVLEVYDAALEAVQKARRGEGVTVIVAETYRMPGHAPNDLQDFVPLEELEAWRSKDPIDRFERYLIESGFETRESLDLLRKEVVGELAELAEAVIAEPDAEPGDARTRVFAEPEPAAAVPWTRLDRIGYEDLPSRQVPRNG